MSDTPPIADKARDTSPALDHVEIEIEAILGKRRMTIGALRSLAGGDLVSLSTSLSEPVELRVNGRAIATGEIVAVGNHFGVRITHVGE